MKKFILFLVLLSLAGATNVFALPLDIGTQITIDDKNQYDNGQYGDDQKGRRNKWHKNIAEDQEVEPNSAIGQMWDLEGFFLKGNLLSIVGGFDFVNGYGGFKSGDVFLDVSDPKDARFGAIKEGVNKKYNSVDNKYGYDYVVDLDFEYYKYDVYAIDKNSEVVTPFFASNQGSGPWQYNKLKEDGTNNNGALIVSGSFSIKKDLSDSDTGFLGDKNNIYSHNSLEGIDLGFLGADKDFIAHFTMGCGNDNLMGAWKTEPAPVPEPATMTLLGLGLLGFVRARKK